MITHGLRKALSITLLASTFALNALAVVTDISTDPLNTYSAPSSTDVKPNVLFVLDDSGSMGWDFMPDWACASNSVTNSSCNSTGEDPSSTRLESLFRNSAYNGVYYNPATTYVTPVLYNADGSLNTTTYPSQTSANTAAWTAVKNDGYGVQFSGTTNLATAAKYFYTFVAGEWCNSSRLTSCQTSQTSAYANPASLRWCNSSAASTAASPAANSCQAAFNSTSGYGFTWARAPSPNLAKITVAGTGSTAVTSVTVGSKEILFAATTASTDVNAIAAAIAANINKCTVAVAGNCQVSGYAAYAVSGVVTIAAPLAANITYTPAISKSGSMSVSPTAFTVGTVPGANLLTVITSERDSYPYPGASAKSTKRADCAGTVCTYAEEMTNYANWWAYYRTRMQTMKSATSNAFSTMDSATDVANNVSRFRVGYMSINNNTDYDFLNLNEFKTTQKNDWFAKLFAAYPSSSTPLRHALSTAGRLYAGKLNGATLNGSTVSDPLQFSCQQNYTILSTDGYWNEANSTVVKLNGSTEVGNQDGGLPPPYNDGGSATIQARTSNLQSQTSTLKTQTNQLQQRTSTLEQRRSNDSGATWFQDWTAVSSCTPDSSGSTRTQCRYTAWTGWSDTATCTSVAQDTSWTWSVGTARQCQWAGWTALTPVATCTAIAQDTTNPYNDNSASNGLARNCVTSVATATNVSSGGSCTATTVPDANGATTQCQYTGWSGWTTVSSCTAVAQSTSPNYTVTTAIQCQTLSTAGTSNTLADVAAYYYAKDLRDAAATSPDATGTCTGPVIAPATVANDLCANNVPPNGLDVAQTQHMTTFTLGLGAQGLMAYSPTYQNDSSGDFHDVAAGTTANPASGICSWMASGTCTWPQPSSNNQRHHRRSVGMPQSMGAAPTSAPRTPASLATGLSSTLAAIINTPRPRYRGGGGEQQPEYPASSDNYVFSSSYKSGRMVWRADPPANRQHRRLE